MAAGLLLGLFAQNVPVLIVSRVLQGLAIGAGVTTAVAALGDLHPAAKNHAFVALVTTVATVVGLAGGPLVAGMLAEFGPWPTILPYLVSLALTALVFIGSARAPETVRRKTGAGFHLPKIAIPAEIRAPFLLACYVEMTAYAVAGTMAGLGSSFTRDTSSTILTMQPLALSSRFFF
jgi:MFS family permease